LGGALKYLPEDGYLQISKLSTTATVDLLRNSVDDEC
jgi:hypothetical protein